MQRIIRSYMMTERFRTKIFALQMRQDDPKKCTSAKLCRMKLATPIPNAGRIPKNAIVLNPSVKEVFSPEDRPRLKNGLVAIDCSWKYAESVFNRRFRGLNRRLPILLAGNPVNYAKQGRLSSAEAISGALYIAGYIAHSKRLVSIFKWGTTFLTLNQDPLEEYRLAETSEEVKRIECEYFKQ